MEDLIQSVIIDIETRKKQAGKTPCYALLQEIKTDLINIFSGHIEEMRKAGKIDMGETINDNYVKLNV